MRHLSKINIYTLPIRYKGLGIWLYLGVLLSSCTSEPAEKPTYRALTETVFASGYVHPRNEYQLFAKKPGVLQHLFVAVNDTVKPGQVICQLDDGSAAVREQNARILYNLARSNQQPAILQLRRELETLQSKLESDSLTLARTKRLHAEEATTQAQLENAQLAYLGTQNQVRSLEKRINLAENEAEANIANAKANLEIASLQGADNILLSQIHGIVYAINYEAGEMVNQNQPVAILGSPRELELRLSVDESDILRIQRGQKVMIEIDSYPDSLFTGQVRQIHPLLNNRDQTFRVDVSFTSTLPGIYAGLSAEANIVIAEKARTLTVPAAYLLAGDSLEVRQAGKTARVPVQVGLRSLQYIEILSGIDETTELLKP